MKQIVRLAPEDYMSQRPSKEYLAYYVTFRPNVLPDALCDELVQMYEDNPQTHVTRAQGEGKFKFDQLNLTAESAEEPFKTLHKHVVHYTVPAIKQYLFDIDFEDSPTRIPTEYGYEHFRINKVNNNGKDGFGDHTDVGDYESARRFITVLYYLTDVDVGGDAVFPTLGFSCHPKKGSILVFPSTWQYLHRGDKPLSAPKYIMTTFCHYL